MPATRQSLLLLLTALVMNAAAAETAAESRFDRLLSMDLDQLQNLTVSSASGVPESLRHAPAAMIVITADDIRRRGYDSLVEVLQDVPGFDVTIAGGTNYATAWQRGYRSPFGQRTLLLVDGVVNNELWSQAPDLSRQYPLQMLDRIEILYGPASAVYGANAFAGVVNLITRPASAASAKAEGQWQLRGGSFNTRTAEGAYRQAFGDLKIAAGARLFRSDDPGLDDLKGRRGFVSADWLANTDAWGPVLALSHNGRNLGGYYDPAADSSWLVNLDWRDWKAGLFWWRATEGYGQEYATDHAQVNVPWSRERSHIYLEHRDPVRQDGALTTRLTLRQSREWGDWAEAEPDWHAGQSAFSYVSNSHWNSQSHAWSLEQKLDLPTDGDWRWLGGWKVERRTLAKAYSICGYWEPQAYCPADPDVSPVGPEGFGPWVVHSTANAIPDAPDVPAVMSPDNRVYVTNRNAHLQGAWSRNGWRASLGLLLDHHGVYGTHTTPRLSLGRDFSADTTVKLLYGRAWQEPPTIQVYGGWNGRNANPGLQPEKAANTELVLMHARRGWLHELSLFDARYSNAIREVAVNASGRHVQGAEYRGRFEREWLARTWSGYLYYTWTLARDDQHYDAATGVWTDGEAAIGDIARHKLQLGIDVPLADHWNLNLRGRYVGRRELYSGNPLRALGDTLDPYVTADLNLEYRQAAYRLALTINNLGDAAYETPGIASADAGTDTSQRATGYYNSLLPQTGRSVYLSLGMTY
ncbi:iron complex outermembrane receptor protein [Fluviicoccus keumensis]|uniref:Iron complex outermembrane receptor protein n=1 Tax=Fluviicoccus keumensis TaxID=1435465 RepID=A0A4V2G3S4_9GAMM|nr:TonB-dependent receptor plug domain-containing protein [Fluviicoccus keumensis]RZU38176.1 iron complex outermembrane receptor protein [Fluviicoccus keumensis]